MLKPASTSLRKHWQFFILALVLVASSYALAHSTLFRVHDFVHGARIAQMSLALKDGHFPVIWTRDFGFGYGMPLFEFYAPLPYYIGSLFYLFGGSLSLAIKAIFFLPSLLSLIGAYLLGRDLFQNKLSGLVLASLFVLAPYRALNLFVRGAVSESWGMAFYPLILWTSLLVIKKKRLGFGLLVLSLVGLFLSHNLSVVMFLPFAIFWTGATWILSLWFGLDQKSLTDRLKSKRWWLTQLKTPMLFVASYLLAFGLASFYLVPAFLEKSFTQMEKIIIGNYFDFHLHFIYLRQLIKDHWGYGGSGWGPNDGMSFFLGWGQWFGLIGLALALIGVGLVIWLSRWQHRGWLKLSVRQQFALSQAAVGFILLVVAVLFTTEKSLFLWEAAGFLKYMQFPWRYLSVAVMFLSLAVASLPALLQFYHTKQIRQSSSITLLAKISYLVSFVMIGLTLMTSWRYFRPERYLDNDQAFYYADRARIAQKMSAILPDYIPKELNQKIKPNEKLRPIVAPAWLFESNNQQKFKVLVDKSQASLLMINLANPTRVVFARAYYPGWQVEIDGQKAAQDLTQDGLIAVLVPKGEHLVGVYLQDTFTRQLAKMISLISMIIMVAIVSWEVKSNNFKF